MAYDSHVRCPACARTFVAWRDAEKARAEACPGCGTELAISPGAYPVYRVGAGAQGHPGDRPFTADELATRAAERAAAAEAERAQAAAIAHAAYQQRVERARVTGGDAPKDHVYDLRAFIEAFLDERSGSGRRGLYDVLAGHYGVRLEDLGQHLVPASDDRSAARHAWLFSLAVPLAVRLADPFPGLISGAPCDDCRPHLHAIYHGRRQVVDLMVHFLEALAGDRLPPPITSAGLRDLGYDDGAPGLYSGFGDL